MLNLVSSVNVLRNYVEMLLRQNIYKHDDYTEFWGYIWQINCRPVCTWVMISSQNQPGNNIDTAATTAAPVDIHGDSL
jgi:hypothetical protein